LLPLDHYPPELAKTVPDAAMQKHNNKSDSCQESHANQQNTWAAIGAGMKISSQLGAAHNPHQTSKRRTRQLPLRIISKY
jgi:hypothetical protein